MATRTWLEDNGVANVAQIDTQTYSGGPWTGGFTVTYTMTAEDGSTQVETYTTVAAQTDEQTRDGVLAVLQGSSQSLFQAVTWASSGTDKITGTAKTAGVPFYLAATEDDTAGAIADAHTTANVGRNDWNTAANWSGTTVPVADDIVIFNQGSHDVLYGLDQSSIDLQAMRIGKGFKGRIGNNLSQYYLQIDISNVTSRTNPTLLFQGGGDAYWIDGLIDNCYVAGGGRHANLLRLKGTVSSFFAEGNEILGIVTVADATAMTNIRMSECPGLHLKLGENITGLTLIEINSGKLTTESGDVDVVINLSGTGELVYHGDADEGVDTLNQRGGIARWNGSGILENLSLFGGLFTLNESEAAAVTIGSGAGTINVYGGQLLERNSLANVTYNGNISKHGGDVQADNATTITTADI